MWRTVSILALAVACHALPAQDTSHSENEIEGFGDCLKKDSTTCLKYKFFSFVDKMMGQRDTFSLTDGVTVVRASDVPPETGAPRSLNPVDKVKHYFETHSLRVEVKGSDVIDTVSSVGRALEDTVSSFTEDNEFSEEEEGEGRGKKKKVAKILGPLMGIMAMKMLAMMPLKIGVIALIAGKALLIGKLALVLSAIIGLKKLLSSSSGQQKHVTYEVVAHPHHSSSHSSSHDYGGASGYGGDSGGYSSGGGHSGGGGGGWGRSADAQSLAYSAQMH